MFDKALHYAKAHVAFVGVALTYYLAAYPHSKVGAAIAAALTALGVYRVPNK